MPAAYQDENGKWFKQCSKTGTLFGPVDNKEDLSQWFGNDKKTSDLLRVVCRQTNNLNAQHYRNLNQNKFIDYYNNNRCNLLQKRKEYRLQNKNKLKQYRQSASGLLAHYKKSAKKRGIDFTLTLEWFEEQMTKPQFNICAVSHVEFVDDGRNPLSRSLDRVDSTKGYHPNNVKWICFKFNSYKSDLTADDVGMLHKYMLDNQTSEG